MIGANQFAIPADVDSSIVAGFQPAWRTAAIPTQYICQIVDLGTTARHAVYIEAGIEYY
jgi:hypothetical protein